MARKSDLFLKMAAYSNVYNIKKNSQLWSHDPSQNPEPPDEIKRNKTSEKYSH